MPPSRLPKTTELHPGTSAFHWLSKPNMDLAPLRKTFPNTPGGRNHSFGSQDAGGRGSDLVQRAKGEPLLPLGLDAGQLPLRTDMEELGPSYLLEREAEKSIHECGRTGFLLICSTLSLTHFLQHTKAFSTGGDPTVPMGNSLLQPPNPLLCHKLLRKETWDSVKVDKAPGMAIPGLG